MSKPLKRGGTFLPHVVLRDLMPVLGDSEMRVLLVVLGKTVGWRNPDGKGRKRREWISHGWLKAATGRSGQSVSDALALLIVRDILEATDENGAPLATKRERRAHRGKLYLGLSATFWNALGKANPGLLGDNPGSTKESGLNGGGNIKTERRDKDTDWKGRPDAAVRLGGWSRAGSVARDCAKTPDREGSQ